MRILFEAGILLQYLAFALILINEASGQNQTNCDPCKKTAEKIGNILSTQMEIQESLKLYKSSLCGGESKCGQVVEKLVPAVIVAVLNRQNMSQTICNSSEAFCNKEVKNCTDCAEFLENFMKV